MPQMFRQMQYIMIYEYYVITAKHIILNDKNSNNTAEWNSFIKWKGTQRMRAHQLTAIKYITFAN